MRVAIVTGTSSGIGLYTTIQLAKQKYKVIALMRPTSNTSILDEQLASLSLTEQVEQIKLNMENVQDIEHTIDYIKQTYERIDVLINNAGYAQGGLVELVPEEAWQHQFQANVLLTVNFCRVVAPIMREQRYGKIINVGSISGQIGLPAFAPYAMSKFALAGFSESLRFELLPFNVYVVLIEAGSYQTSIWDKGFNKFPKNTINDYDVISSRMVQLTKKSAQTKRGPISLADFIVKIVNKNKPTFRQVATWDVKLTILFKSLISWKLYEKIMNFVFKFSK